MKIEKGTILHLYNAEDNEYRVDDIYLGDMESSSYCGAWITLTSLCTGEVRTYPISSICDLINSNDLYLPEDEEYINHFHKSRGKKK